MQCRLRVPFWPIPSSDPVLPTFTLRSVICVWTTLFRTAIRRPRETRWPGANIRRFVLARLPFVLSKYLYAIFPQFPLLGARTGVARRAPRRGWTLDSGLSALLSAAVWNLDPLGLPHHTKEPVANPQLFRLQYFSLRFHSAAAHLPRTLARHPIRPTCCPMRRIHHGIRR